MKREPGSAFEAYTGMIDALVQETRISGAADSVGQAGSYLKGERHTEARAFVASLTEEQQRLLASMLRHERDSAIHDVLAEITWWVICREVGFTFRGEPMPVDLSGCGLHGDYVGRCDDWDWPQPDSEE